MSQTIALADAVSMTVGDVMIRQPKTLPADALVADVRRQFERPSVRSAVGKAVPFDHAGEPVTVSE